MKIVSACLAGINCRWDWWSRPCEKVMQLVKKGMAILVCPEQMWWLSTPRFQAEKVGEKIIDKEWNDVTIFFENGAKEALKIALMAGCDEAILKSKSPSCGCWLIFDWTFSWNLVEWDWVFVKLLKKNNIKVISEKDL